MLFVRKINGLLNEVHMVPQLCSTTLDQATELGSGSREVMRSKHNLNTLMTISNAIRQVYLDPTSAVSSNNHVYEHVTTELQVSRVDLSRNSLDLEPF